MSHNLWLINLELIVNVLERSLVRLIKHKTTAPNRQYDFEINIFFDDAFTQKNKHDNTKVLNSYVNSFLTIFEKVLAHNQLEIDSHTQSVFSTPYGGRIDYHILGTPFSVHLKDKQNIRRGKRWSQVMYLYYLIGWKMDTCFLRTVLKLWYFHLGGIN